MVLDIDERILEDRRRKGADRRDEMWNGVLHMGPPAGGRHQRFGFELAAVLRLLARRRGLLMSHETGLFRRADDYRVPDFLVYRPEQASERGVDGSAELAVEIRSPGDETYDKLAWYAELGVAEVLVIDRDTLAIEILRAVDGAPVPVTPDGDGRLPCTVLGARLAPIDSERIEVIGEDGERHEVALPG